MNYFDGSAWIGKWPFALGEAHTARSLVEHLRKHGIARALVSPLDAVFAPEPGQANRELLKATLGSWAAGRGKGNAAGAPRPQALRSQAPGLRALGPQGRVELIPVPVINPVLANWREELAAVAADRRVRVVRVLPAYHGFSLEAPAVGAMAAELAKRRLRLAVQVRLIDERHEFHAMNLKPVPVEELAAFLRRHSRLPVLAGGLLRPEVFKLAPRFPRLIADLAFVEWHDTLEHMLAKVPVKQLAFASHTPLLITAASQAKVAASFAPAAKKAAVAAGNLVRFLGR